MNANGEPGCPVCGENMTNASVKKYGPKVCRSCGMFFLHNSKGVFHCEQKACVITKTEKCRYCRLKKCVDIGMVIETASPSREPVPASTTLPMSTRKAKVDDRTTPNTINEEDEVPIVKKAKTEPADSPVPTRQGTPLPESLPGPSNPISAPPLTIDHYTEYDPHIRLLATALPPFRNFAQTAAACSRVRSTRFSFALALIEDTHKKWVVTMFDNRHGFNHLPPQFKVNLSRESYMLIHLIDAAWAITHFSTMNPYFPALGDFPAFPLLPVTETPAFDISGLLGAAPIAPPAPATIPDPMVMSYADYSAQYLAFGIQGWPATQFRLPHYPDPTPLSSPVSVTGPVTPPPPQQQQQHQNLPTKKVHGYTCSHCKATETCKWRDVKTHVKCNACFIYERKYGKSRPTGAIDAFTVRGGNKKKRSTPY